MSDFDMKEIADEKDKLIMLYEFTGTRIAEFKAQQRSITNYGLLIYAAIVSSKKLINDINTYEVCLLNLLALIVLAMGIWLIKEFSASTKERQRCLTKIRDQFGPRFIAVWNGGDCKVDNAAIKPKTVLKYFHQVILIIGFIISTLLIWRI